MTDQQSPISIVGLETYIAYLVQLYALVSAEGGCLELVIPYPSLFSNVRFYWRPRLSSHSIAIGMLSDFPPPLVKEPMVIFGAVLD